jgi:hypothetical protein
MGEVMITGRNGFLTILMLCSVLLLGQMLLCRAFAEDITVTIDRKYSGATCTSGYIEINGKIIAYTVELPWNGNKPFMSSIPAGSYYAILRYDKPDRWRIQLEGVPNRSGVQIHTGNGPDDTEGCILIGTDLNTDLCSLKGGTSRPAYAAFKKAFYGSANPASTTKKRIVVKVAEKADDAATDGDHAHQMDQFEGVWVAKRTLPKNEFGDQVTVRATGALTKTQATFVNEITFTAGTDRHVKDCPIDVTTVHYIEKRQYNLKFDQETQKILLNPVGTATISAVDPCWTAQTVASSSVQLHWDGKILSDELGEHYRRVQ